MGDSTQVGKTGKRSPWDNRTIVRRLHGVEYELFEDSDDIYDYVNTDVKRELETDQVGTGRDPSADPNISSLSRRKWRLEVVDVRNIQLNPLILDSIDVRTERKFSERIVERQSELRSGPRRRWRYNLATSHDWERATPLLMATAATHL